jgi:dolichyl-phosphate beta-glucosyltransferase
MRPFLSVIVPAYNEERRLPATLAVVQDYLERAPWAWELIVADDGSRDRTIEVARAAFRSNRCRVSAAPRNQGKGAAVRRGMLEARGRFRLFTDADNSTPIEEVGRLLRRMRRTGAEVAIASRAKRGARIEKHQPWHRELMGRTFNGIVQVLAVPGIQDTQCGFKLFRAEAAREIFRRQTLDGFSFDVEVLLLARRLGFEIVEVPVRWIDHPDSRVSPLKDSARVFRDVLTVRWRHRGLGA